MQTTYTVILADGTTTKHEIDWPQEPGYHAIAALVRPLIGPGRDFERVNVLHDGKYTDMFVDAEGLIDDLPRNELATVVYRNNVLTHEPGTEAESLPHIAGPVVLFARKVW